MVTSRLGAVVLFAAGWSMVPPAQGAPAVGELAAYFRAKSIDSRQVAATQPARWEQGIRERLRDFGLLPNDPQKADYRVRRTMEFLRAYYMFAEAGNVKDPNSFRQFQQDTANLGPQERACAALIDYALKGDLSDGLEALRLNPALLQAFAKCRDDRFGQIAVQLMADADRVLLEHAVVPGAAALDAGSLVAGHNMVPLLVAIVKQGLPASAFDALIARYRGFWEAGVVDDPLHLVIEVADSLGRGPAERVISGLLAQGFAEDLEFEIRQNPRLSVFVNESVETWLTSERLRIDQMAAELRATDGPTSAPESRPGPNAR